MKKRFTQEQIAFALRQAEGGVPVLAARKERQLEHRLHGRPVVRWLEVPAVDVSGQSHV